MIPVITEFPEVTQAETFGAVERLNRDLVKAIRLSDKEARFLVDTYYQLQDDRIRSAHQVRTLEEAGEPNAVLDWLETQNRFLEEQLKAALGAYAFRRPEGEWMRSITGIGPVISAGLLAGIDVSRAPTAGALWRFAGYDPSITWGKGEKRPWNARLKVLGYKAGESFIKFKNNPKDNYGHYYDERKAYEQANNEAGLYKVQADYILANKKIGKDTEAYKHYIEGHLPPGHIHARARRWVIKLFLSHVWEVMYWCHYQKLGPRPYVLEHMGHVHKIAPPNLALVPGGMLEAYQAEYPGLLPD